MWVKIWTNIPRVLPHIICYALNKHKRLIINKDIMARPPVSGPVKGEELPAMGIMQHTD